MGTELFARGLHMGTPPERVNLEQPELLHDIARDYAAAGAQVLTSNTFGASPYRLAHSGLHGRLRDICTAAVRAIREAAPGCWLAGNIGPCGELLQPYGEASADAVRASFVEQCAVLAELGVDLFLIETMIDVGEALLAVEAARSVDARLPIACTLTFEAGPRGFRTIMGCDVARACQLLSDAGVSLLGANCGQGSESMARLGVELCQRSEVPVLVQSNAGLPEIVGTEAHYSEDADTWAAAMQALLDAGVAGIGGCCGTTPAHIAALRGRIDACIT